MEALSTGFCAAALSQSLTCNEAEEWQQQWPQPTLQVVDIQRYPRTPTVASQPCRFYVAASDGQSLVWLVVPPHTPLEEAIAGFELEVGCCVTLLSHTLVTAANGLNVVVPLQVKYSSNTLRLLGQPSCPATLFSLSPTSLVQRSTAVDAAANTSSTAKPATAVRRPSHRIAVRDFVASPEKALGNWSIAVRVVWRGRDYSINSSSRAFGSTSVGSGVASTPRYVFRCLLVDECGDGIVAAFFGGEALLDRVQLHDCLLLAQGTVKWGVGEVAAPVELQFVEKSIEELPNAAQLERTFPLYAAALVGEAAQDLHSVAEVLATAQIGDFTSVVGVVAAVQGSAQITTKRGRVSRAVVTLANDTDDANGNDSGGGGYVEVTLWGDVAESVEPALGERWVFHSCAVQLFQQRKTLSSRSSTMAVQLRPVQPPRDVAEVTSLRCEKLENAREAVSNVSPLAAGSEAGTVASTHSIAVPAVKSRQFVLDFHVATSTLPVLARVQEVLPSLLTWNCTDCHSAFDGSSRENPEWALITLPERCAMCGGTELSPSYSVQLQVSDGLCVATVALYGSAAETLLGTTAMELTRAAQRRPAAGAELCARLLGLPILMWLVADVVERGGSQRYIAAACKHIRFVSGCHMLLSALEGFAEEIGIGTLNTASQN